MFNFIKRIFTWWNSSTIGTQWYSFKNGKMVGVDDEGNKYFQTRDGSRRWVMFNGTVEATRVPPEWHAWLHKTVDLPPTEDAPVVKSWEKEHIPNLSGTSDAYHPHGEKDERKKTTGDYEAWQP